MLGKVGDKLVDVDETSVESDCIFCETDGIIVVRDVLCDT